MSGGAWKGAVCVCVCVFVCMHVCKRCDMLVMPNALAVVYRDQRLK